MPILRAYACKQFEQELQQLVDARENEKENQYHDKNGAGGFDYLGEGGPGNLF